MELLFYVNIFQKYSVAVSGAVFYFYENFPNYYSIFLKILLIYEEKIENFQEAYYEF